MRLMVTGADGFLGWHFRCFLSTLDGFKTIPLDRGAFNDDTTLIEATASCDAIVHFAGVNKGEPGTLVEQNVSLMRRLLDACDTVGKKPLIVFASSTHIFRDTEFGQSKIEAAAILAEWAKQKQVRYVNLIIPNIFGEFCRPHYNSVVATFSHELIAGRLPTVIQDNKFGYLHALDLSRSIVNILTTDSTSGDIRLDGEPLFVTELLTALQEMHEQYQNNIIPLIDTEFKLRLFNTYRSYTGKDLGVSLTPHTDSRGALFEALRTHHGGQLFYSTTKPGIVRGNHFHLTKFERFLVVRGEAVIRFRKVMDGKVYEVEVSGDEPTYVDIPTLVTHNIENTGGTDLYTLFWSNAFFDPEKPDTYFDNVER